MENRALNDRRVINNIITKLAMVSNNTRLMKQIFFDSGEFQRIDRVQLMDRNRDIGSGKLIRTIKRIMSVQDYCCVYCFRIVSDREVVKLLFVFLVTFEQPALVLYTAQHGHDHH